MALDTIKFASFISMLTVRFGRIIPNDTLIDISTYFNETPSIQKADLQELFKAIVSYRKIDAIKEYRILTGEGLKESKDAVESIMNLMEEPNF